MSGTAQFEGRTAEEAVARARAALGDSGALRCWKTRRGGVGGFFAKEVFVAGLTPPPGSETARGRSSRTAPGRRRGRPEGESTDGTTPEDGTGPAGATGPVPATTSGPARPDDHLFDLVEATADQVSLGSLAIPSAAFDEVLAEAQAALTRLDEAGDTGTPPHGPAEAGPRDLAAEDRRLFEPDPALPGAEADGPLEHRPDAGDTKRTDPPGERKRPAATPPAKARPTKKAVGSRAEAARAGRTPAAPRSTAGAPGGPRVRSARMPDLRPGLRGLGVPSRYLPRGQRPSLDQLIAVMGTLPTPPALPTRAGAVVAVVGSDRNRDRTVDLVTAQLSLGRRDVVHVGGSTNTASVAPQDVAGDAGPRPGRQIARRRSAGRTSVMAVQAGPGQSLGGQVRRLLDEVAPDYVLAAVDAACKRVDVEHWTDALPHVDALALWDLSATRSPGELLGLLPIAFVDGEQGSALRWTLTLAGRTLERDGR